MKNENPIIAKDYDKIDGKKANASKMKQMTIGWPSRNENQGHDLVLQTWQENEKGDLVIEAEIPFYQLLDGTIFLLRTLQHFSEAYRFPHFFDEKNPQIDRIGLQGGAMTVEVNSEDPEIKEKMKELAQIFSDNGELTGERLRVLTRILKEMGYVR